MNAPKNRKELLERNLSDSIPFAQEIWDQIYAEVLAMSRSASEAEQQFAGELYYYMITGRCCLTIIWLLEKMMSDMLRAEEWFFDRICEFYRERELPEEFIAVCCDYLLWLNNAYGLAYSRSSEVTGPAAKAPEHIKERFYDRLTALGPTMLPQYEEFGRVFSLLPEAFRSDWSLIEEWLDYWKNTQPAYYLLYSHSTISRLLDYDRGCPESHLAFWENYVRSEQEITQLAKGVLQTFYNYYYYRPTTEENSTYLGYLSGCCTRLYERGANLFECLFDVAEQMNIPNALEIWEYVMVFQDNHAEVSSELFWNYLRKGYLFSLDPLQDKPTRYRFKSVFGWDEVVQWIADNIELTGEKKHKVERKVLCHLFCFLREEQLLKVLEYVEVSREDLKNLYANLRGIEDRAVQQKLPILIHWMHSLDKESGAAM